MTALGQPGLVRHGLRHTALRWMADAGVDLHILQRVAGHQDPAVTGPLSALDVQAMLDTIFGVVVRSWSGAASVRSDRRRPRMLAETGSDQSFILECFGRTGEI